MTRWARIRKIDNMVPSKGSRSSFERNLGKVEMPIGYDNQSPAGSNVKNLIDAN